MKNTMQTCAQKNSVLAPTLADAVRRTPDGFIIGMVTVLLLVVVELIDIIIASMSTSIADAALMLVGSNTAHDNTVHKT